MFLLTRRIRPWDNPCQLLMLSGLACPSFSGSLASDAAPRHGSQHPHPGGVGAN